MFNTFESDEGYLLAVGLGHLELVQHWAIKGAEPVMTVQAALAKGLLLEGGAGVYYSGPALGVGVCPFSLSLADELFSNCYRVLGPVLRARDWALNVEVSLNPLCAGTVVLWCDGSVVGQGEHFFPHQALLEAFYNAAMRERREGCH